MQVRAIRKVRNESTHWLGTVAEVRAADFSVTLDDESAVAAQKAVSCLVEPRAGDRVLVCDAPAGYYVLAILERRNTTDPLQVVARTGLQLSAPNSAFSIDADSVRISGHTAATLTAPDLQLAFKQLAATGQEIIARSETMRAISRHASTLFERLHSRIARSYKVVSELEHMSAKQINYQVSNEFTLHSKNSIVTSEELLKFDGKLVQIG
jgi:hypothetical protein